MICGIDAGGTQTRVLILDEEGKEILKFNHESIHYLRVGFEGIKTYFIEFKDIIMKHGIDAETMFLAIGMAGYGEDEGIRKQISDAIYFSFPQAKIYNDAQFAHIAALKNKDGVYVISGTGSIALYKKGNLIRRSGGFGYLLDDGGSAYWIGKKILEEFVMQADGRHPQTALYKEIMQVLSLKDPYEIVNLASINKGEIRNFTASIAAKMATVDDPVLDIIYKEAGIKLAELANSFKLNEPTNVSIGGSVLLKNDIVRESFIDNLHQKLNYNEPIHEPEYAAYILKKVSN